MNPDVITKGIAVAGDLRLTPGNLILPKVKRLSPRVRTAGEHSTGWRLPTKGIVLDCWVDIITAEATQATKTIDVGLLSTEVGGDADGFLDGVSNAATGVKKGGATVTAGGNESYFASTTKGVLLSSIVAGADVAGDVGTYYEFPHILNGTARTVSYTYGGASTEVVADIYVMYLDFTV